MAFGHHQVELGNFFSKHFFRNYVSIKCKILRYKISNHLIFIMTWCIFFYFLNAKFGIDGLRKFKCNCRLIYKNRLPLYLSCSKNPVRHVEAFVHFLAELSIKISVSCPCPDFLENTV